MANSSPSPHSTSTRHFGIEARRRRRDEMRHSFAPTLLAVAAAAAVAVSTCRGNLLRFDGEVNVGESFALE